jgi:hypothetical protein
VFLSPHGTTLVKRSVASKRRGLLSSTVSNVSRKEVKRKVLGLSSEQGNGKIVMK